MLDQPLQCDIWQKEQTDMIEYTTEVAMESPWQPYASDPCGRTESALKVYGPLNVVEKPDIK